MKNIISFNQIILAAVLLGLHAPSFAAAGDDGNSSETPNLVSGKRKQQDDNDMPAAKRARTDGTQLETVVPTQEERAHATHAQAVPAQAAPAQQDAPATEQAAPATKSLPYLRAQLERRLQKQPQPERRSAIPKKFIQFLEDQKNLIKQTPEIDPSATPLIRPQALRLQPTIYSEKIKQEYVAGTSAFQGTATPDLSRPSQNSRFITPFEEFMHAIEENNPNTNFESLLQRYSYGLESVDTKKLLNYWLNTPQTNRNTIDTADRLKIRIYQETKNKPVLFAASTGNTTALEYIIEKLGADALTEQKIQGGATALHIAAAMGHQNFVAYIVENLGAGALTEKLSSGATALHCAAQCGKLNIVQYILKTDPTHDFRMKLSAGHNIIRLVPADKKDELMTLLKQHLLGLHEKNSGAEHIKCSICLEPAIDNEDCQAIANEVERIALTPCCLQVICAHDMAQHKSQSERPTCPHCRAPLT